MAPIGGVAATVQWCLLRPSWEGRIKAPVRDAKSSCAKNGDHPYGMAEDEDVVDFDASKDLDTMYKKFEAFADDILLLPPPPPAPLSQEEEFQEKLKEITERCIGLHMDAMARLRPVQLRPLLPMADTIYVTFARVAMAAKKGRANSGMVVVVADTLDLTRKLFSSICKTHLPRQGPKNLTVYLPDGPAFGRESEDSNNSEASAELPFISTVPRVPPDMFLKEKDKITNYMIKMSSSGADILNVNAIVLAQTVCSEARTALDLASEVMDIASIGLGTTEICEQTTNQMVRQYTTTFLNVAEDAYHKRVKMEAIISFLGALRGLGAICHILVKGTVDRLEDGPFKDSITCSMDVDTQEFDKKVNNLKDKFMAADIYAYKVVTDILFNGTLQAQLYVSKLVECRKAALPHIKG
ncbi:uncharacterized protein C2845_PM08G23210 [Panicum miliaceum]|uniref:Uncharacterized protein n=1 Tax=Panicum miliaceum TaxID=4540 RepID=A0A3L6QZ25_PANMI|nr:uncharacterized protein C2845_PM08G23210 [Panicum miliaceum]